MVIQQMKLMNNLLNDLQIDNLFTKRYKLTNLL